MAGLGADQIDADAKLSYQDEFVAGFEYEAFPNINLGVRYIHRNIGRVLEDIADAPAVAYDLGLPGLSSRRVHPDQPRLELPDPLPRARRERSRIPKHVYDAVEFTAGPPLLEQLAGDWPATAGRGCSAPSRASTARTTASRTRASPRSTTSRPTTRRSPPSAARSSATWATSATWARSATARCRSTGRTRSSWPAPTPSTIGLSLGANVLLSSGKPLTALAALAAYDNDSEIPLTPRGDGFETFEGFKERTPFESQLDLQASYALNFGTRTADAAGRRLQHLQPAPRHRLQRRGGVPERSACRTPTSGRRPRPTCPGQMYQTPVPAAAGRALRLLGAGDAIDGRRAGVSRPFSFAPAAVGHGRLWVGCARSTTCPVTRSRPLPLRRSVRGSLAGGCWRIGAAQTWPRTRDRREASEHSVGMVRSCSSIER